MGQRMEGKGWRKGGREGDGRERDGRERNEGKWMERELDYTS
jgi:hypothetical protein